VLVFRENIGVGIVLLKKQVKFGDMKKAGEVNILVACEESQAVCVAFRNRGFNAFSCDILPSSGGYPEWHIQGDLEGVINGSFMQFGQFWTEAGTVEKIDKWDVMISFPPCTYLTVTANRWYKPEFKERYPTRGQDRLDAIAFFMMIVNSGIEKIAIENPVGIMSTRWRRPNQVIQPWQFGDRAVKKTCLWLIGLPKLDSTNIVEPEYKEYNSSTKKSGKSKYPMLWAGKSSSKERSKTFPGIAEAMADQWGNYLLNPLFKMI